MQQKVTYTERFKMLQFTSVVFKTAMKNVFFVTVNQMMVDPVDCQVSAAQCSWTYKTTNTFGLYEQVSTQ